MYQAFMLIMARGTVRLEKCFFYINKKRLNYGPDSFEVRSLLLLSSSLKIDEHMQTIDVNSWLECLINQNKLLFLDCTR